MIDGDGPLGTSKAEGPAGKINILRCNRDLHSNWEVDVAKNLEEYLLKICSGEIPSSDPSCVHHSVNFAEAALLLQGSVQVYSRKVDYLYSLVLHALEFLSQKRKDQQEKASTENNGSEPDAVTDEESEIFLVLDDVPVETNNCLDDGHNRDETSNHFVKPPANLLVSEGGCLDTSGDAGELEAYLLGTCDFYGDFLLLDPCDAGVISDYLKSNTHGNEQTGTSRGSSIKSKVHDSLFRSPTRASVAIAQKSCLGKTYDVNLSQIPECTLEINYDDISSGHDDHSYPEDNNGPDMGFTDIKDGSDDDYDDPWIPLDPFVRGNLKIKPFVKGKFEKQLFHNIKSSSQISQFPLAKLDGFIRQEFAESFGVKVQLKKGTHAAQSPPFYEKLRRSLTFGTEDTFNVVGDASDDGRGGNDIHDDNYDFSQPELDLAPGKTDTETELPVSQLKQKDTVSELDGHEPLSPDNSEANESLDDLYRSHQDALLANIAETEKQMELAARVSTWKQRIEHNLEEQERHPPFDIHQYAYRIVDKLSKAAGSGGTMSFTNVVLGQHKHEVARTFCALLQLVNNGNVELQRAPSTGDLVCHTGANPFQVRLLRHQKRREDAEARSPKKRMKTPLKKCYSKANPPATGGNTSLKPSYQNIRIGVKIRKGSTVRGTPEGKRRKLQALEPVNLRFGG